MSMLTLLSQKETWERFYEYKTSLACPKQFARELRAFIDRRGWEEVCAAIGRGAPFPLPRKAVISKLSSQKKRTVYIYPRAENTVLKLLTYLLLRRYDGLFSPNLYSFRAGRCAKDAMRRLCAMPGIRDFYAYKVDISNYFNSIPIGQLLPMLEETLGEDPVLLRFLKSLLCEPNVLENGAPVSEEKGIMAGTPLSAFYANLYLRDLDRQFHEKRIPYARYSDDIIVFAQSREQAQAYAEQIRGFLLSRGLSVNRGKEHFYSPAQGWEFLGFSYRQGRVDIAPATVSKLKGKMRRKARALMRWRARNDHDPERAAAAFIRVFNRKLLEATDDNELSWGRWFFSVINTAESLREIDRYAQDCLRYLLSGTRTKARFNIRYETLKDLGYRSLVHQYYADRKEEASRENDR